MQAYTDQWAMSECQECGRKPGITAQIRRTCAVMSDYHPLGNALQMRHFRIL